MERNMSNAVESSISAFAKKIGVGGILEVVGVGIFFAGVIQLFHHGAIAACVLGGVGAFFAGKKLRSAN